MTRKASVTTTTLISSVPLSQPCVHLKEQPKTNRDHWIESPLKLLHSMSDEELFWRASLVPELKNCPFTRVPKIAFMFLTKGPLPLAPLWERFFKGHEGQYSIYIHSLPSYEAKYEPTSAFYGRQIPSQVAEWGRMSMCDAERRLIANALLDISNEHFVLLSESCIPLFNFTLTYQYITNSKHSFMGAFDDPSSVGRGRYNYKMSPLVKLSQWRKGSQWFEIHRNLAYLIISDKTYYPKFEQHCRPACYVDEHYFPTMLSIQAPESIANRSLTWVDWSRGGPHPATFGKSDITEQFMKKLRGVRNCFYNGQPSDICYLFARKFSPGSLEALLSFAF
ncbi:core-2/I-branching beta-1,6-N-acetylglucosaminyltransferase family protein [Tanacetum coccineum]